MLHRLRLLSRHRFWMSLLFFLLTWPACELSQEIGIYTVEKLQVAQLRRAQKLWENRSFHEYQTKISWRDEAWTTWEQAKGKTELPECLSGNEILRRITGNVVIDFCQPQLNVNQVFEGIEASFYEHRCGANGCRCDGTLHIDVDYDDQYGYPTRITREYKHDWKNTRWLPIEIASFFGGCFLRGNYFADYSLRITPLAAD